MAYVNTLEIVNATSIGLIVASDASVPTASAKTVYVRQDGIASDLTMSTGGTVYVSNGGLVSVGSAAAGNIYAYNGGVISGFDLSGAGRGYVSSGAVWSGGTVSASELDAYDAAGGGIIRGVRQTGGATLIRFAGNLGEDIKVSGGTFWVQSGASGANIDIYKGGTFSIRAAGSSVYLSSIRIHSGGVLGKHDTTKAFYNGVTIDAGGQWTVASNFVMGGNISFAKGTFTNDTDASAENGVIKNLDLAMNGSLTSGVTLSNFNQTAAYVFVYSGAAVSDGRIAGGEFRIMDGAVASNVDLSGTGRGWASSGGVWSGGTVSAGELDVYDDAGGGIVRGTTILGGAILVRSGGNIASSIQVSGGALHVQNGASAVDIDVYAGATLALNNRVNANVSNIRIHSDGVLNGNNTNHNYQDITVDAGGAWTLAGNFTMAGNISFVTGGLTNDADAYAENGVIYNFDQTVAGDFRDGVNLSNFTAEAVVGLSSGVIAQDVTLQGANANRLYVYSGAVVKNAAVSGGSMMIHGATGGGYASGVVVSGGALFVRSAGNVAENIDIYGNIVYLQTGGTIRDVTIHGGELQTGSGTAENVTVLAGGSIARFSDGAITWKNLDVRTGAQATLVGGFIITDNINIAAGALTNDADAHAENGVIYDFNQAINGSFGNGITLSNYTLGADGDLLDGAAAKAVTISGGALYVSSGAKAEDVTLVTNRVYIKTGGAVSRSIVRGGEYYVYGDDGNSYASDVKVSGGALIVRHAGNLAENIVVSGGEAHVQSSAIINDVMVYAGNAYVSQGGFIGGATVSGGSLHMYINGSGADIVQSGGRVYMERDNTQLTNVTLYGGEFDNWNANGGGLVSGATVRGGDMLVRFVGNVVDEVAVSGGKLWVQRGASATNVTMLGGEIAVSGSGGNISELTGIAVSGGKLVVQNYGLAQDINMTGGVVSVTGTGVVSAVAGNTIHNANTVAGAKLSLVKGAMLTGSDTKIVEGTLYFCDTAVAGHATSGVLDGLSIGNAQFSIGDGIIATNAVLNNGSARLSAFEGAVISGVTVTSGAIICADGNAVEVYDATLIGNGTCNLSLSAGAYASNTTVGAGGKIQFQHANAKADNTTIMAGGSMVTNIAGADTGDLVTLDFTGTTGNQRVYITNLANVKEETEIVLKGETAGNTYTIANTGATNRYVQVGDYEIFGGEVKAGETFGNAFTGKRYEFNGTGTAITVGTFTVGTKTGDASALTNDDAIAGGRAVKWNATTGVTSGNVFLAGDMTSGQAWVELDGYTGGENTTLYGAQGNSFATGTVNILAKSGSLRNLAAGANAGGTVKAVNLSFEGAELDGTGYVGGFGNVTGETKTLITTGSFAKDFYAGALANKLDSVTSVGDVSMTIDGGTFSGNIFGASAVKTDTTKGNGTRHTAGDVTLTVTGGSTTKGTQACIFAGGYATGDATGTVYTVDSVTATISGGSWGEAAGGRGIFGGIMASGVTAQAGDINLIVSGGSMGNVYGGGWAQKTNGKSIVGDVNLTISGGTIANVFGGGSHSTSGGTTETGDITITVSGGNITGDIYARGQLDGDTTGAASVIFTGANDFDCGVFGYSYVGGAASDAALSFSTYTGEFSGNIGGFSGITFDGATAMTLDTAATDVSNGAWKFDLTDRANTLAGTSLLTWGGADFENDTIKVTFADDAQAQGGWNIATVAEAFSGTTFDVEIGGAEIVSGLAYNQQIAAGDYAGWGFDLESGVLKFKQLA